MLLVHESPFGALEIVGVPGVVDAGVPFEVPDAVAEGLLVQSDLFKAVEPKGRKA